MEAVVCHVFNTQYILLSKQLYLQMIIAINLWFRLRTLVSATVSILDPHQNSSRLSCYCPVSWKFCSLDLQNRPFMHSSSSQIRWILECASSEPKSGSGYKLV